MEEKYLLGSSENLAYCKESARKLLSFGKQFPSPDGSSYYLGSDGTPQKERPRETWITARMLHVYSIGAMAGISGCKELAKKALEGLMGTLYDLKNGGWYAGIQADGSILPGKQCYAHAFVILSGCSAYLAGLEGAKEFLDTALKCYDTYFFEPESGMSRDFWNTEFTILDSYRGLNANMHTVEAYLAVWDTLKKRDYLDRAGIIIAHTKSMAETFSYRLPEHYTKDWKPLPKLNQEKPDDQFKPYGATPGHGMEWARLIVQWALASLGDKKEDGSIDHNESLESYIKLAKDLYQRARVDGWKRDGAKGFLYTTDWDGSPVVCDRMHWTLAEAINTAAVLFKATGEDRYLKDYAEYLQYLEESVLDLSCGSWYHQLDEKNYLKETVWPGKPDIYHAFQAMLIPHLDPKVSVAVMAPTFLQE